MTDAQKRLAILQHTLGLDQYGAGESYRNHFVTGERTDDYPHCAALVAAGLMVRRDGNQLSGGADVFHVTHAGRVFVAENSPRPPKLSASARRYRRFLAEDGGLRFGEWLRAGGGRA